jgi:hypothetical protein
LRGNFLAKNVGHGGEVAIKLKKGQFQTEN